MRAADAIVTLSDTMKREIVERGVPPSRITVIPNAVDVDRFTPLSRDDALARRTGLPPGEPVVGYISTLLRYEGIDFLVDAVALLRSAGTPVHLLVVGDGPEREALERRAAEAGLGEAAHFTGRVPHDDVPGYYSLIDVFVVPRRNRRVCQLVTPLKPYEAMAMERPLVVSGVAALVELANEEATARVFRPEDARDLSRVIDELLRDPVERARLGKAARRWVVDNRTWEQNGRRYRLLYESLGAV